MAAQTKGIIPRLRSFRREDYAEAPEWFGRFLGVLGPFVGDVTSALGGGLDPVNLGRQYSSLTLKTDATLASTFASGKVVIKNQLNRAPRSVKLGKCQPTMPPIRSHGDWTNATLLNAWTNYGNGYPPAGYRLVNGRVWLRGVIASGALSTSAFELPVGMRPEFNLAFSTEATSAYGDLRIWSATTTADPPGQVEPRQGTTTYFSLEGISFEPAPGTWRSAGPFGEPQWTLTQNGTIQIDYIAGLSPLTDYEITFEIT